MLGTIYVRQYGTVWVRCGTGRVPLWHYLVPCGWQVQKQRGTRCATLSDQLRFSSYVLIKCTARTAQDVADLVPHQLFDPRPGWAQILAWIELLWVLREDSPAARRRHARRVGPQLSAVIVDFLHQIRGHARGSVQHQRIIAEARVHERLLDGFEPIEVEVLFPFKLIRPV